MLASNSAAAVDGDEPAVIFKYLHQRPRQLGVADGAGTALIDFWEADQRLVPGLSPGEQALGLDERRICQPARMQAHRFGDVVLGERNGGFKVALPDLA